jgi:hypothetical protein
MGCPRSLRLAAGGVTCHSLAEGVIVLPQVGEVVLDVVEVVDKTTIVRLQRVHFFAGPSMLTIEVSDPVLERPGGLSPDHLDQERGGGFNRLS